MPDRYEIDNSTTFVNPYNFIPLEESCAKNINYIDRKRKGELNGWLECTLETKSPIFVPNTNNEFKKSINNEYVKSFEFFSYDNLSGIGSETLPETQPSCPLIPGSEIRGAIRSAYEAVTNSCLSTIEYGRLLFKRTLIPGKPGQLVFDNGNWMIRKCKKTRISINEIDEKGGKLKTISGTEFSEADKVEYNFDRQNHVAFNLRKNSNGSGIIHIGEDNVNKKTETIFAYDKDKNGDYKIVTFKETDTPQILFNLVENILLYRSSNNISSEHNKYIHLDQNRIRSIKSLFDYFREGKINFHQFNQRLHTQFSSTFDYLNGAFIYYKTFQTKNGMKYYIGPAAIGREVFYNKLSNIINSYKPCCHRNQLCPACALFGLVAKAQSTASRVRFTDADYVETPEFEDPAVLNELASPKITATEFYVKKKSNIYNNWNYDYAMNYGNIQNGDHNYEPEIRGRKFYWHKKDADYTEKPENVSERNVHVRPMKKGNTFNFKVYFNNITKAELNTLIWVLEIGGSDSQAHKIGMGKPIGLGSVQISVKDIFVRRLDDKDGNIKYKINKKSKSDFAQVKKLLTNNSQILAQFMTITNFDQAPKNVCYPFTTDLQGNVEEESYKWFVENRKVDTSQMRPKVNQELPELKEDFNQMGEIQSYRRVE